jgi:polysaccharide biosynthesis protein PslJ
MASAVPVPVAAESRQGATDAAWILIVFIVLVSSIPGQLVVPGLGGAGRPASLFALAMLGWWLLERLLPRRAPITHIPIRWAISTYLMVHLVSVIAGLDRGVPGLELRAMDRFVLLVLGLSGVMLVAIDGLPTRRSVERVQSWAVALGAVSAVVGIIQFVVGVNLAAYINIPGLQYNSEIGALAVRGAEKLRRAEGLTLHSIELGVVMPSLLPMAMYLASVRRSRLQWVAAATIAAVIPMSISKTGIVAVVVAMAVYAGGWTWRQRSNALVIGFVVTMAYNAIVPGLLSTIKYLFLNLDAENSTSARTDDIPFVAPYIRERPWFGRGPGTFGPEDYRLLDNAYLLEVIEGGWIGLASLLFLLLSGCWVSYWLVKRAPDPDTKNLARALGAGVSVSLVGFATYDAMAYPTQLGLLALHLGCLGALYRIERGRVPGDHGHEQLPTRLHTP